MEDVCSIVDEGHRNLAKVLVALRALEDEHVPFLRELYDAAPDTGADGKGGLGLEHDYVQGSITEAMNATIAAMHDLLVITDDVRELGAAIEPIPFVPVKAKVLQ